MDNANRQELETFPLAKIGELSARALFAFLEGRPMAIKRQIHDLWQHARQLDVSAHRNPQEWSHRND